MWNLKWFTATSSRHNLVEQCFMGLLKACLSVSETTMRRCRQRFDWLKKNYSSLRKLGPPRWVLVDDRSIACKQYGMIVLFVYHFENLVQQIHGTFCRKTMFSSHYSFPMVSWIVRQKGTFLPFSLYCGDWRCLSCDYSIRGLECFILPARMDTTLRPEIRA